MNVNSPNSSRAREHNAPAHGPDRTRGGGYAARPEARYFPYQGGSEARRYGPSRPAGGDPWRALGGVLNNRVDFMDLARVIFAANKIANQHTPISRDLIKHLAARLRDARNESLRRYPAHDRRHLDDWSVALSKFSNVLRHAGHGAARDVDFILYDLTRILEALGRNRNTPSAQALAQLLYHCSCCVPDSADAREFMSVIAAHIRHADRFSAQNIGNALYGLQNMRDSAEARAVLSAIAAHIPNADQLKPQNIGNALYGLHSMGHSDEAHAVLSAIAAHIPNADRLSAQNIGNALYGLQNMRDSDVAHAVLSAIAAHIRHADQLKPQHIGNALYGLQNMGNSDAARAVLSAITEHIRYADQLSAQAIGNALYGLQKMGDSAAAHAVLSAIAAHIRHADQLKPQNIGNALYGLQNMGDSTAAHAVLSAIAAHIRHADQLSVQAIGNALYGLQNMGDSAATRAGLSAIAAHIPNVGRLDAQAISNALCGLQTLNPGPEVAAVLGALTRALTARIEDDLDSVSPKRAAVLLIAEAMNSLRRHLGLPQAADLLRTLASRLVDLPRVSTEALEELIANPAARDGWTFEQLHPATNIDLHGHSHALAERVVDQVFARNDIERLAIITGRGTHNLANRGRMQAIVEKSAGAHGWRVRASQNEGGRLWLTRLGG